MVLDLLGVVGGPQRVGAASTSVHLVVPTNQFCNGPCDGEKGKSPSDNVWRRSKSPLLAVPVLRGCADKLSRFVGERGTVSYWVCTRKEKSPSLSVTELLSVVSWYRCIVLVLLLMWLIVDVDVNIMSGGTAKVLCSYEVFELWQVVRWNRSLWDVLQWRVRYQNRKWCSICVIYWCCIRCDDSSIFLSVLFWLRGFGMWAIYRMFLNTVSAGRVLKRLIRPCDIR